MRGGIMIEFIITILECIRQDNNLQLYAILVGIFIVGSIIAIMQKKIGDFFIMLIVAIVAAVPIYLHL